MNQIILFDGECNFCNSSVQFIIKREEKATFKFASIQSDTGKKIFHTFQIPFNFDSLIVVKDNQYYSKSTAALLICKYLKGGWKLFYPLILVPKPIRDFVYDVVAKNRYKWFGRNESCMLPSPEMKERFLE